MRRELLSEWQSARPALFGKLSHFFLIIKNVLQVYVSILQVGTPAQWLFTLKKNTSRSRMLFYILEVFLSKRCADIECFLRCFTLTLLEGPFIFFISF